MSTPLRVLLVEGPRHDAELILQELARGGFESDWTQVKTGADLRAALADGTWEVVLSSDLLPGLDAAEVLACCRKADAYLPFIVVSGGGEERADALLRSGVSDCLPRSNLGRLAHVVRRELRNAAERRKAARVHARHVTARRQAEEALRLRDRAIQAVSQGILITDPNQRDNPVIYVSPGYERLTGYTQAEVLGRNCRFLQGKDTDRDTVGRVREAVRAGRPCLVELLNYRKDGTPFWNELSISPVRDDAGRLTRLIGVLTDVTQRRQLEDQYRQSQKMEAIGQLAGGVAHDFNNMLCIINGYSDLLLRALPSDHPSYELLHEIRNAGERSASLTRQLLVFSRKQVVAPKVLDLNAIVTDAEKMLRRVIGEDVRLTTSLAGDLGRVRADEGQVQQVLMNLVVNARDAMPQGGKLAIETRAVELNEDYARLHLGVAPGPYVMLAVTDTGCGMTPEVKARLFEPFFTTKEVGKGTGLGLAVVHGVVQQAGGHVEVQSEPGAGATFKVYLPQLDPSAKVRTSLSGLRAAPGGTETVLLVEDDDGVRSLTHHMLTRFGYTVLDASGGNEALRAADKHAGPIHLLITDVVMPGKNGREVAERITALHPEARTLFVSGYTDDAVVRHGLLQDNVNFLPKPFSPIALACKIRDVLDGPGPEGA